MQRDAIADHRPHRVDQGERWAREPTFRGQIDEIQAAHACKLRGARRRARAAPGRDRDKTWITAPWRRTAVNTEAKYLMLRHAFETFGCIRVELKTDSLNQRSRNAIRRIAPASGACPGVGREQAASPCHARRFPF